MKNKDVINSNKIVKNASTSIIRKGNSIVLYVYRGRSNQFLENKSSGLSSSLSDANTVSNGGTSAITDGGS